MKFQVVLTPKSGLSVQAKGMQDPEIQNILTDPVMRQVWCMSDACYFGSVFQIYFSSTIFSQRIGLVDG